jgi:uncharacterized protein YigE (DUF2233 family)
MRRTRLRDWLAAIGSLLLTAAGRPPEPRYVDLPIEATSLQLFWRDPAGRPWRGFRALESGLRKRGQRLAFAMNAGMYHADFRPVGLLVVDGRELAPLELRDGAGNFFLKPNGVFWVDARGAHVTESAEYARLAPAGVRLATQSGPLLLRAGAIHPAFDPASRSRHVRNGVGVCDGRATFVISQTKVTLHEFARHFRDDLRCTDALYLDGVVSSLHSRALGRSDRRAALGPMFAVVEEVAQ